MKTNLKKIEEKDFDYSESFNPNKVLTNREKYATIKKLEIFERIYLKI
jgi:tRNA (guanine-N7-)-methyltransferase